MSDYYGFKIMSLTLQLKDTINTKKHLMKRLIVAENLGDIFSLNPNINTNELDGESLEYIKKLVDKNVLLYLSN